MSFLNILPDPNYPINAAGQAAGTTYGPGFVSVEFSSTLKFAREDSIGGRTNLKTKQRPSWAFKIRYNPLTKDEFFPVYSFLMEKRGSKKSFYVSLPQYQHPKDPLFATFVQSSNTTNSSEISAGSTECLITATEWATNTYTTTGLPTVGDMFNIHETDDSLHSQAYMVTRIETFTDYEVQPTSGSLRVHFTPPSARQVQVGSQINFDNPLFRVRQTGNIQQYSLDTEDLYEFSVQFEESA